MQRSLETVVKGEWITSWLRRATFIKTHPGHHRTCAREGHGEVFGGGGWGSGLILKHWWKEQQRQKSIFARVDGNSLSFQAGCLEEFGRFSSLLFSTLGALYLLPESLIHCAYSRALYHEDWKQWESSRSESHAVGNIGIHHMIVHLLHTLSCNLFFCTSLVPLCMWVSVCVCL